METRKLGKTGINVSLIGFGGIPIQRCTQNEVNEIIKNLINKNVNFIDTARTYTISEKMIGEALCKWGHKNFYLATKTPQLTYNSVMTDVKQSLVDLQTNYIDLYQFHNPKTLSHYKTLMMPNSGYAALVDCKKKGLINHIGITSHSYEVLNQAIDDEKFDTIQFPYNLIENRGITLFEKARSKNIGVIVMKPLAGGAFMNSNFALRWVAENPNISTIIPGMDSVKQVLENTHVGTHYIPLSDEERKVFEKDAKNLGETFCRRCGYCAPCPQGIDIPMQFIVEGYYQRYNLKEWAIDRYNSFSSNASDCIQCGECEPKCPYHLPIREMLKRTTILFDPLAE